jgi:BirA family transcriptional regulator, biotin operon repressor / biotin---[acetyl-CoA-carboxylase] ligase
MAMGETGGLAAGGERSMRRFDMESFRRLLRTRVMGQTCYAFDVLASTNASLYRLGRLGKPEGTVVLADQQTAGRGQADKVWISPPQCNLYVSIILRPCIAPTQAPLISLLVAVALVDTLRQQGVVCGIKWPNDVLIHRHKVAGILAELELHQETVEFVVVGIGINVNMTQETLQTHLGPIAQTATSVQIALGHEISREALLAELLASLEQWYTHLITGGETGLQKAWEARSLMRGQRITAQTAAATWQGTAEGIDQAGRLLLRRDAGDLLRLTSAEVRFLDRE